MKKKLFRKDSLLTKVTAAALSVVLTFGMTPAIALAQPADGAADDAIVALDTSVQGIDSITNTTTMFKVYSASLETTGDQVNLRFALNGTGYPYVYMGTYEQAVANGDGSADKGNGTWYGYTLNEAGKYEFVVPVSTGNNTYAVCAISASKYTSFLAGTGTAAQMVYARYLKLDTEALTLESGDYAGTTELTVTVTGKAPAVTAASLYTVGAANSNNYAETLTVATDAQAAYLGTAEAAASATEGVIEAAEGEISILLTHNNMGGSYAANGGWDGKANVAFELADGTWVDTAVTVDKIAKTAAIAGEITPVTAEVTYIAQAAGAFLAAPTTAEVSSNLAESYGYVDSINPNESVSAADVLVAANLAIMGEVSTDIVNWSESGYVNTLFGVGTYANGFLLNKGYPNDGTESSYGGYNGTTITTTKVVTGDVVDFLIYQDDSYYSDKLSYVEVPADVKAGQAFDVTVKGTSYMAGYMYKDAAAMKDAAEPLEGISVATMNPVTGELTDLEVATDENGKASITLAAGDYYLVAYGTDDEDAPAIMNATKVTVAAQPVTATVTYAAQAAGAYLAAPATVEVSSNLAESYGYADSIAIGEGVSAADVLVAANLAIMGEVSTDIVNWSEYGYVNTLFGTTTSANGFLLNKGYPNDGTESQWGGYNGTTITTTKVVDGDVVDFYIYQDVEYYNDRLTYVEAPATVAAGQAFDVTVTGTMVMMGYLYKDPAATKAAAQALDEIGLGIMDPETGEVTPLDVITDIKGKASVTLPAVGEYYLVALGDEYVPVVMNATKVTVTSETLKATNNYKMFTAGDSVLSYDAEEGYTLELNMKASDSYTKLRIESQEYDLQVAEAGNSFTFPVTKVNGEKIAISLCSKKNGAWYDRVISIDAAAGTLNTYNATSAEVTYAAQVAGAYLAAPATATVSSTLAESYGYIDSIDMTEGVSAADVMVAANLAIMGEVSTDIVNWNASGYVNTLFGTTTYANGFLLNKGYPNDGTESQWGGYNGTTITTTKVATGDVVDFYIYMDSICYGDYFSYVDIPAYVPANQAIDVTVTGTMVMAGYMYKDAAAMKAAAEPLEEVTLGVMDPKTGEVTSLEAVTDEDGKASIMLAAGEYYLVAMGDEDVPVVMNPTKVVVDEYIVGVAAANDSAHIGDTVTVDVTAASAKSLGCGEFIISYDGTLLKLVSIVAGKDLDLGEGETAGSFEATLATGKVSFYGNNAAANNGIVVATATFEALAEGTAEVTVTNALCGAWGTAKDVTPTISDPATIAIKYVGSFEISSKDYTATKMRLVTYVGELPEGKVPALKGVEMARLGENYVTVVTAGEAAALTAADLDLVDGAAAGVLKNGDVNINGAANIVDAQIAYDIATGVYDDYSVLSQMGFLEADVNNDLFVDAADALAIQNYVHRGSFVK